MGDVDEVDDPTEGATVIPVPNEHSPRGDAVPGGDSVPDTELGAAPNEESTFRFYFVPLR